jgi:hypothetical protein
VKTPPQITEVYGKMAKTLNGSSATLTLDARGRLKSGPDVTLAPGADPTMGESVTSHFRSLAIPLPEEPVGPGGSWSTTHTQDQNGARLKVVTTYTLKESQGGTLKLDVKVTGKLAVSNGGQGPELGIQVGGGGKAEFTLERVAPLGVVHKMVVSMNVPGPKPMKTTSTMHMLLKSSD